MDGGAEAGGGGRGRPRRVDARRNVEAVLGAAKAVFVADGVDAPVRAIADRAGVGVGTVYRHFPSRADLVAAVFRREVDACAAAADPAVVAADPWGALTGWLHRYADFIATKRGLAAALHSGDPAFAPLPAYFQRHLEPALQSLLGPATAAGVVRSDVAPADLLRAVANLCQPPGPGGTGDGRRMVDLLIDGLRHGAGQGTG